MAWMISQDHDFRIKTSVKVQVNWIVCEVLNLWIGDCKARPINL